MCERAVGILAIILIFNKYFRIQLNKTRRPCHSPINILSASQIQEEFLDLLLFYSEAAAAHPVNY
jgi:hypothetical protein